MDKWFEISDHRIQECRRGDWIRVGTKNRCTNYCIIILEEGRWDFLLPKFLAWEEKLDKMMTRLNCQYFSFPTFTNLSVPPRSFNIITWSLGLCLLIDVITDVNRKACNYFYHWNSKTDFDDKNQIDSWQIDGFFSRINLMIGI